MVKSWPLIINQNNVTQAKTTWMPRNFDFCIG